MRAFDCNLTVDGPGFHESAMQYFLCQTNGQILSRATKSNFPSAE